MTQSSASLGLPSSHSSPVSSVNSPLPQPRPLVHSGLHGPPMAMPSSQISPTVVSTMPLLHDSSDLQFAEQPSASLVLPSSQISSLEVSILPLPHDSFDLQSAAQPSPSTL